MRTGEVVVLVHGIWMSGIEMSLLRYRLQRCGYKTYQFHYASLRQTPAENAVALNRFLKKIKSAQIHLLAHSLGGIVLMHLFHRFPQQKPGRVVMLSTPANGSELARRFEAKWWLRPLLGQSFDEGLRGDTPAWLATRELGLIVGEYPVGILAQLTGGPLKEPSDGTVTVHEAMIEQARDQLRLPVSHAGILFNQRTATAVCHFLKTGKF